MGPTDGTESRYSITTYQILNISEERVEQRGRRRGQLAHMHMELRVFYLYTRRSNTPYVDKQERGANGGDADVSFYCRSRSRKSPIDITYY